MFHAVLPLKPRKNCPVFAEHSNHKNPKIYLYRTFFIPFLYKKGAVFLLKRNFATLFVSPFFHCPRIFFRVEMAPMKKHDRTAVSFFRNQYGPDPRISTRASGARQAAPTGRIDRQPP